MKLKPEIKQLWVDALRSGKYQQGEGVLKSLDHKFCCLGVLCDLKGDEWEHEPNLDSEFNYESDTMFPPASVTEWAVEEYEGVNVLESPCVRIKGHENLQALSEINDYHKYTFEQIADLIEEQL
jgi:hypothetical protein